VDDTEPEGPELEEDRDASEDGVEITDDESVEFYLGQELILCPKFHCKLNFIC